MHRLIVFLLALCLIGTASADRRSSLDDAVSEAREKYGGKVLSAETQRRNGQETYNVRILTRDGQVRRLRIDPKSGGRLPPPRR